MHQVKIEVKATSAGALVESGAGSINLHLTLFNLGPGFGNFFNLSESSGKNFILTAEGAKHTKSTKKTTLRQTGLATKSQIFADGDDEEKKSTANCKANLNTFKYHQRKQFSSSRTPTNESVSRLLRIFRY